MDFVSFFYIAWEKKILFQLCKKVNFKISVLKLVS